MNEFIKGVIDKMKPTKPTSPSDLEVITGLLSDKFIEFHTALIKQGAMTMAKLDELLAVVAKETEEGAALVASNNFLVALNVELKASADAANLQKDAAVAAATALQEKFDSGVFLTPEEWAALKDSIAGIVVTAPIVIEAPVVDEPVVEAPVVEEVVVEAPVVEETVVETPAE
jgi:hypothetical protein